MATWMERVGALHVHSRYSDGTGTVGDILRAARAAGLDHVVLTDHDCLAARREGWEGLHEGVALLAGAEVTPRRQGHVIALGIASCAGYAAQPNRVALDGIHAQGGDAIIAHPRGKRSIALGIHHVPWRDWDHPVVRGLEIWSYTHDWVDGIQPWRAAEAHAFWAQPERQVKGPYPDILAIWDRLGAARRLAGWGALDCHARHVPLSDLKIFAYERMFTFLRNHLFVRPADWSADPVAAVREALVAGRGFVGHDVLADSAGTRCGGLRPDGRPIHLGEESSFFPGTVLTLALPRSAEVRWIANGRCRLRRIGTRVAAYPAEPGVYRFEAWLDGRPWIFTNAFYLRPDPSAYCAESETVKAHLVRLGLWLGPEL